MNEPNLSSISESYLAALRIHIEKGEEASLPAAHEIGSHAVSLGMETLDLALIHETALAALLVTDLSANARVDLSANAAVFFTETLTAIEKTHRLAKEAGARLEQLRLNLGQLTQDLEESNRDLRSGIAERKKAEAVLEASAEQSSRLINESRDLEEHLQKVVRNVLSVSEDERKKMSLQLNDDISQSMLGIHMRLLALKKLTNENQETHCQEIATIQRLVEQSLKTITRFAP